jgi:uncharacterized protein involved in response to NO
MATNQPSRLSRPILSSKLPFAPLWASPFRPFCAAGMAYGIALMATWLATRAGFEALPAGTLPPQFWHGHEMLFGFAAAIICATVLTALPGWAGTPEIHGAPLAALVALWFAGRAAFWAIGALPWWLVVAADGALYVALLGILAAQLLHVHNRYYLLLLVVLAGMLAADVLLLAGYIEIGLKGAVYSVALLFALKGGVFAPVFTGNYLRSTGRGTQARFVLPLEFAAIGAILVLAACDLGGAPQRWTAAAALCAFALHTVRLARWQGWKVRDVPLLWTMHAGYAWMVVAFLLLGLGELGVAGAARAWLHAFTVGALGSMMLGLMTRVALRHTGRPLVLPRAIVGGYFLVQAAALLRVGAALAGVNGPWIIAAGLAWIAAFAIYLRCFGRILLSPSMPRIIVSPLAVDGQTPGADDARG